MFKLFSIDRQMHSAFLFCFSWPFRSYWQLFRISICSAFLTVLHFINFQVALVTVGLSQLQPHWLSRRTCGRKWFPTTKPTVSRRRILKITKASSASDSGGSGSGLKWWSTIDCQLSRENSSTSSRSSSMSFGAHFSKRLTRNWLVLMKRSNQVGLHLDLGFRLCLA